jgi:pilus assembly protein CpaC
MSLRRPAAAALAVLLALPSPHAVSQPAAPAPQAPAQVPQQAQPAAPRGPATIVIEAGSGRLLRLPGPAEAVFAADPQVAEVRPASPNSLFVFGTGPGRTTVVATGAGGAALGQWQVVVRPSRFVAAEVEAQLARLMPDARVRIEVLTGAIMLTGEVASAAQAEHAVAIVRGYAGQGQEVINRLAVRSPVQVNLRVRVAEMSREISRELGFNWEVLSRSGNFAFGLLTGRGAIGPIGLPFFGPPGTPTPDRLGFGYSSGNTDINGVIDALARDDLITVLAEPNLTAQSGETASFLAGGEFPIPVARQDNEITIEFKQFGVSLAFVPTVLSNERITLRVRPEVSELSDNGAIQIDTLRIPALAVRRAETTVELGSGQSFAIAGLFQDSTRIGGSGLPFISEIPVLGALFRSDRFRRKETELVIIVTPYIVRPVSDPRTLASPTDGYRPPSEIERILLFRQRAGGPPVPRRIPGEAGFIIQ